MMTIVWDVDDVLNQLTREWFEKQWLREHPGCSLKFEELRANPPFHLLGAPEQDYLDSLDRFRLSAAGVEMKPTPEIYDWFVEHGERCRHIALTARPLSAVPAASSWVFRHFGAWIRTFGFVPAARPGVSLPAFDRTKGEWLEWMRCAGHVLVDDNPDNLRGAAAAGLETIMIPQPWNDSRESLRETLIRIGRTIGVAA